jgi:diketogulonate reductase-like aldo/keto reductase
MRFQLGFGTLIPDPAAKEAVRTSLEVGFRQFDCAESEMKNASALQAASSKGEQTAVFSDECFLGPWTRCSSM